MDLVTSVSAIIVTRGDVDTDDVVCSFPPEWEVILWDNGANTVTRWTTAESIEEMPCDDLAVYGRYAAIKHATHELIYVQDDDCIVSDPQVLVNKWMRVGGKAVLSEPELARYVVCNMPEAFRHSFYAEHALVGFGAVFHRDAPRKAFERYTNYVSVSGLPPQHENERAWFNRTCDIAFTALTPRVLVDVPYRDLDWASNHDRMWKQPTHQAERARMLDLARQVRNAS